MPYFTKKGTGKDKGKTCVYKKDDKTKVGCTDGPIEKYMAALHIHESEDLNWLMGPTQIRFGDIKDNIKDYVSVGDTIYLSGILQMIDIDYEDGEQYLNKYNSIELDMEPVVVREPFYKKDHTFEVTFGDNVTNLPVWTDNMSDNWVDLGAFKTDDDLLITIPEKKSISESEKDDDLDWIKDIGSEIQSFVEELRNLIKEYVPVAHLELDWDTTTNDGEYFGKVWLYDRFYELYKYDKFFKIVFYYLDPETDRYEVYSQYENLPKYRLLAILLNDMINVSRRNLNESEDFDDFEWIIGIEPDELSLSPDVFFRSDDEMYYTLDQLGYDMEDVGVFGMSELAINNGYRWSDKHNGWYHRDEVINLNTLRESESEDEWGWVKGIETDLVPGEIYDIKTGNGYYWVPELYVGKDWDDKYQVNYYKFKDLGGSSGSGRKSEPYVRELIQKGDIKPYDPNWSIKDELTFSDNIEDALKGNFAIYFKDGVYLDQTLPIQDKLFEMGFSFYTKGPNEYITNKDSAKPIQFFESFNWDTSNPRYKSMPSDQWDQKKILLNAVQTDDFRWKPTPNPRMDDQELFLTAKNHNAIIINGDKYVTDNINESEEFDWIHQQEPEKELKKSKSYVVDVSHLRPAPMRFSHDPSLTRQDILRRFEELGYNVDGIDVDSAKHFYLEPQETGYWDDVTWILQNYWVDYDTGDIKDPTVGGKYQMIDIDELMFLLDNNLISESVDDFEWIRDIEPELTVCEAQFQLNVGDVITLNEIMFWPDQSSKGSLYGVKAEVLAVDNCNKIQPSNTSSDRTILIHVDGDYVGFDEDWVRGFRPEYIERCMDGKCMFLICGDPDFGDLKITKVENKKLKESINEVAGISFESRKWADIIYNEIMSNPEEKTRLIIDGYDHPEAFDQFPIDYVVIDYYDRITGYGQEHSGYDQDGNYVVLLYIQPQLVQGQGGYSLKSALNHEMKHAWEDYNRISRGKPNIEQTKESKELYNRDFILLMSDNNVVGPIKDILKYFYYLSKLEVSPYLENVYDENPAYENMVRQITTKDFESFKDRFDLDINWHLINTAYDIPFVKKFKSPREFIDYSAKELRKRATKVLKKINKMKYVHGKI